MYTLLCNNFLYNAIRVTVVNIINVVIAIPIHYLTS